jgi:4-carboxymuconolactone decarboxylase
MTTGEDALLRLAIGDPAFCRGISDVHVGEAVALIGPGTLALMRLSVLVAIGPADPLLHEAIGAALDAGLDGDSIVASLIAVASTIGINQLVAAAPALAVALGYDLDARLESLDPPSSSAPSRGTPATCGPTNGGTP